MITYTFVLLVYYAKSISVLVRQSVCLSVCLCVRHQSSKPGFGSWPPCHTCLFIL